MNRLTSVLAGAATAAISGAVIAAAAVGQGVFDGAPKKSASQDTVQVAATASETADATTVAALDTPEPQIVYVDKEPIYITRTVVQPVADSGPGDAPTQQPAATATPNPPQLQASTQQPTEQPRPAATLTPTGTPTPTRTPSHRGDDHEGSGTTSMTGRTSGHDD